jgi:hypothetical protein
VDGADTGRARPEVERDQPVESSHQGDLPGGHRSDFRFFQDGTLPTNEVRFVLLLCYCCFVDVVALLRHLEATADVVK